MEMKTINNKGRLLALLLAVAMLVVFMPTMSFAEEENSVAKIGENSYATVAAALLAAKSGDVIEIQDGTWGAEAIGSLNVQQALVVRYKSLTIQPAADAEVLFTSNLTFGYDDSSTANATITVKNLSFKNATLLLSNYVQATVEGCSFSGSGSNVAALAVQDSCCINHKTQDSYPDASVVIKDCNFNGSQTGASLIRIRNSGNVTVSNNVLKNSGFNGILFESNTSVNAVPVKTVSITKNVIDEWNVDDKSDGGRAMRLAMGNLASGSTITIEANYFLKETTGLDTPDFLKLDGAANASAQISGNCWNYKPLATVKDNDSYYKPFGCATTITDTIVKGDGEIAVKETNDGVKAVSSVSKEDIPTTEYEDATINAGGKLDVNLVVKAVEKKDAPTTDKELVEEELTSNQKLGMYLDLTMVKTLYDSKNKKVSEANVEETLNEVGVTITIPEELRANGRKYTIIRVHNGVVDTLVDSKEADKYWQITFTTDKFSTYALVYEGGTKSAVDTGDHNNVLLFTTISLLALLGVALMLISRKKAER